MRAMQIAQSIEFAYRNRRPLFIWGPPGIGKTDNAEQVAKKLKIGLIDFRLALRDPTDLKGYPIPDLKTGSMRYLRDEELPTGGEGLLFMDEMNNAPPSVGAAAMQLTLTRRIGSYELPDGWAIIAAGNREQDMGITYRMPAPLLNRFTHIEMDVHNEDWQDWALRHDVSAQLIAFHRWRTDKLFTFDPKARSNAFGTPRSWVATDQILRDDTITKDLKYALIRGTVGDGEGGEYWTFLEQQSQLPSIDDVLKSPKSVKIPVEPSIQLSLITMIASHVTPKTFPLLTEFSARFPMEYQAVFIKDVMKRDPTIRENKVFQQWALKNSAILL